MKQLAGFILCLTILLTVAAFLASRAQSTSAPEEPQTRDSVALNILPLSDSGVYRLNQLLAFHTFEDANTLFVVNDDVMGGRSWSRIIPREGHVVFEGEVRPVQGSGFASVRSTPSPVDLSDYSGLAVKIMGDGSTYSFTVRTGESRGGVYWKVRMTPPAGEWAELTFPFSEFQAYRRGRQVQEDRPLDPASIVSVGFMASSGHSGEFRLHISEVAAWAPRLVEG